MGGIQWVEICVWRLGEKGMRWDGRGAEGEGKQFVFM